MKHLLTFETFVPKNIDQRAIDLKKIQANELLKFQTFVQEFQINLDKLQGLKVSDANEQFLIDRFQSLNIHKQNHFNQAYHIFLDNPENIQLFDYNWHLNILYCNYRLVFKPCNMDFVTWQQYVASFIDKYFHFLPQTVSNNLGF